MASVLLNINGNFNNMRISNKFSQFEKYPALFITSGEYEAHFYIAHRGEINEREVVKMPPREEAREKQGFTRSGNRGPQTSTYSHRGRYADDLKKRFSKQVHDIVHDIVAETHLEEIYVFAPKYVMNRLLASMDSDEQKKVRMQFYKEYTKNHPIEMIEKFDQEIAAIQNETAKQSPIPEP